MTTHLTPTPDATEAAYRVRAAPTANTQTPTEFTTGYATSACPTMQHIRKFVTNLYTTGMAHRNIMLKPCIVPAPSVRAMPVEETVLIVPRLLLITKDVDHPSARQQFPIIMYPVPIKSGLHDIANRCLPTTTA